MNGIVVFYYRMHYFKKRGRIFYKICGQKCDRCRSDIYELPLWYPEEAQKVSKERTSLFLSLLLRSIVSVLR